ncbi:tRNA (uracil-5-)-methyltransferase homolog A-like isoform X3 [Patiria miniata]|uniref:Uncharacterized protein n=1 Tax=Patiria miniata TaxID=46514 RepID=A0A914BHH0_PATMI|nr:tRNA (uracil-5-)-methyltransferase homolog A-like isoform X3 [Patiria miniata]XP_038075322.1 tRNA (uracil-5-)-methyltransferase homolog A-like isoform X3 [Patiria miniata]XP_038075323.1 tRNA (uracil-5-)-methyltransferase homolog A-like isoform X3 [Patiria miniata]
MCFSHLFPIYRLNNTVTPLWNQPYENQLSTKQTNTREFLRNLSKMLQRNIGEMSPWLKQQRNSHSGMACELEPIKPSPVLESYRNKYEFTIGKSVDGIDNTVGFRLGAYKGLDPQDNHSTSTSDGPVTGASITDPYHYLTQQPFTSEIFKIEIQNLPRHFGFALPRR